MEKVEAAAAAPMVATITCSRISQRTSVFLTRVSMEAGAKVPAARIIRKIILVKMERILHSHSRYQTKTAKSSCRIRKKINNNKIIRQEEQVDY